MSVSCFVGDHFFKVKIVGIATHSCRYSDGIQHSSGTGTRREGTPQKLWDETGGKVCWPLCSARADRASAQEDQRRFSQAGTV